MNVKWYFVGLIVGVMPVIGGCSAAVNSDAAVKELRCEYTVDPLGIDVVRPHLSWIIESQRRG